MKEVKTGLVLEGGAMRGMYTAGILDVLMEENTGGRRDWSFGGSCIWL